MSKIYVASSWRNLLQPTVVSILRSGGHKVYDFHNPAPGNDGFSWLEIDSKWKEWTPEQYRNALQHPVAKKGYGLDMAALRECDTCVMVLPCGRSTNWEIGYAMGIGKDGVVLMLEAQEPELMYSEAKIVTSVEDLSRMFGCKT